MFHTYRETNTGKFLKINFPHIDLCEWKLLIKYKKEDLPVIDEGIWNGHLPANQWFPASGQKYPCSLKIYLEISEAFKKKNK